MFCSGKMRAGDLICLPNLTGARSLPYSRVKRSISPTMDFVKLNLVIFR